MNSKAKEKIVFDLTQQTDVTELQPDQLFQPEARKLIYQKLKDRVNALTIPTISALASDQEETRLFYERSHGAILLSGQRGSGKTTFLRNILKEINDANEDEADLKDAYKVLPVIDPTIMESKEHVLVTVIGLIKETVDKVKDRENCKEKEYKLWRNSLEELAGGLCQIDGIGSSDIYGDKWDDKLYVMQNGLKKAMGGFKFEQRFSRFVEFSLGILGKKAFLMAFDDVDTQFERGWPVLESVRKYLTSPRMVIVLSGDLRLFTTLVRGNQFDAFNSKTFDYDRPSNHFHETTRNWRDDPLIKQIDHLEDQYLVKILKPENRVSLRNLSYYVTPDYVMEVYNGETAVSDDIKPLNEYLRKVLQFGLGVHRREDQNLFIKALLNQPARTFWQFLVASKKIGLAEQPEALPPSEINHFTASILEIYSSSLYKIDLDPRDLVVSVDDMAMASRAVFQWVQYEGNYENAYRMLPEYSDERENHRALALSAFCHASMRHNAGAMIDFILRIGLPHSLYLDQPHELQRIMSALGIGTTEGSCMLSRRAVAIIRALMGGEKETSVVYGVTQVLGRPKGQKEAALKALYGGDGEDQIKWHLENTPHLQSWSQVLTNPNSKVKGANGYYYNSIGNLQSRFGPTGALANLSTVRTESSNINRDEARTYMSVYILLGSITELLQRNNDDASEIGINKWLQWLVQERTVKIPELKTAPKEGKDTNHGDDETSEDEIDEQPYEDTATDYEGLAYALMRWHASTQYKISHVSYPAHLMARISERLFHGLHAMSENMSHQDYYAGHLLHRQIVIFLNALLIEEAREKGRADDLRLVHPTLSDEIFFRNMMGVDLWNDRQDEKKGDGLEEDVLSLNLNGTFPLFESLLTCPLIGLFLAEKTNFSVGKQYKDFAFLKMHQKAFVKYVNSTSQEDSDPDTPQNEVIKNSDDTSLQNAVLDEEKYSEALRIGENSRLGLVAPNLHAILNSVQVSHKKLAKQAPSKRAPRRRKSKGEDPENSSINDQSGE
ncbi:ATPase, T2SS/T4P/T4SS family [Terasakiella pusilla]|uniref:ATPase, T2SS/T4P/T4SS family n=1 Tax=Terasakiella pusilla TaxID=64973 RepID=UPI003AA94C14